MSRRKLTRLGFPIPRNPNLYVNKNNNNTSVLNSYKEWNKMNQNMNNLLTKINIKQESMRERSLSHSNVRNLTQMSNKLNTMKVQKNKMWKNVKNSLPPVIYKKGRKVGGRKRKLPAKNATKRATIKRVKST